MPIWVTQTWDAVGPHVPSIALALAILVGGWVFALIVRALVFGALKRTTLDDRIAAALGSDNRDHRIERGVSRFVYYVILAFVVVAFFERLQITAVTAPIVGALSGLSNAVPSLLKAALIAFVGFLVATLARKAVVTVLDRTRLVARLEAWSGVEAANEREAVSEPDAAKKRKKRRGRAETSSASQTLGNVVFWIVIALTAIPVLEALKIGALAAPLENAISVVSTYLPKVLGAAFLAVLGYFLGRAARAAVRSVVDKLGLERGLARVGLGGVLGEHTPGSILGTLAMIFIFLHFAISAVGRLGIAEISVPLGTTLTQIYAFLPRLLVGVLLLAVGVAVARIGGRFARGMLAAVGFNSLMAHIGLYRESAQAKRQQQESRKVIEARLEKRSDEAVADDEVDPLVAGEERLDTPADIGGLIVAAIIVLLFTRQALGTMGLHGLAGMFDSLIGFLPHLLVAALVLGAGMWAGGWARRRLVELTGSSDDRLLKTLPAIAHVAIVAIAAMAALQQLGVGNQIIAIAFGLILGALCLALALAFGLGGREVAGQILAKEYRKRNRP